MNTSRLTSRLFFATYVATCLIGASALPGCGGSRDDDPASVCRQACDRGSTLCAGDAGAFELDIKAPCLARCSTQSTGTCANSTAILAANKACLTQTTCSGAISCLIALPTCTTSASTGGNGGSTTTGSGGGTAGRAGGGGASGTSTGGLSGTAGRAGGSGGASGTGTGGAGGRGAGGSSGGTACADLLACCNAATNPTFQAACMSNYSMAMARGDAFCAAALTTVRAMLCPGL